MGIASGRGSDLSQRRDRAMMPDNLWVLTRIRGGMDVCGSERNRIGTAVKVYRNADYGTPPSPAASRIVEPHLKVDHDGRPLFVPTSSVSEVDGDCVVLNVVPGRVERMGCEGRPDFIQDVDQPDANA